MSEPIIIDKSTVARRNGTAYDAGLIITKAHVFVFPFRKWDFRGMNPGVSAETNGAEVFARFKEQLAGTPVAELSEALQQSLPAEYIFEVTALEKCEIQGFWVIGSLVVKRPDEGLYSMSVTSKDTRNAIKALLNL